MMAAVAPTSAGSAIVTKLRILCPRPRPQPRYEGVVECQRNNEWNVSSGH